MSFNATSVSEVQRSWIWAKCQRHEARYALLSEVDQIIKILKLLLGLSNKVKEKLSILTLIYAEILQFF